MAVANVDGITWRNDAFPDGVRGAEDHVEPSEVQTLDGARHQRKHPLVIGKHPIERLEPARANVCMAERIQSIPSCNGREEGSPRKHLFHFQKHMFGASEDGEPVGGESKSYEVSVPKKEGLGRQGLRGLRGLKGLQGIIVEDFLLFFLDLLDVVDL